MLAESYKKQAQKWPSLKPGDKEALRKYSVFLTSFANARKGNPELQNIDGFGFLKILVRKLPTQLQQRWINVVGQCRDEQFRAPTFEDFQSFV